MDATYLSGLFGLGGVAVGAVIAHRREKSSNTFRFHEEFSTEYMLRCRATADHVLKENPNLTLKELYKSLPENHIYAIRSVIGFYDKLYVATEHNRVNKRVAVDLFGRIFIYWYNKHIKKMSKDTNWHSIDNLSSLYEWFSKNTHHKKFSTWVDLIDWSNS